jgi:hypothetical protein
MLVRRDGTHVELIGMAPQARDNEFSMDES